MKIALINGSPKVNGSSSEILLGNLKNYLFQKEKAERERMKKAETEQAEGSKTEIVEAGLRTATLSTTVIEKLGNADIWVIACPLYVDGIPGHLLSCLMQLEKSCLCNRKISVYGIINCGFYEGIQTEPALEILENWCERTGLKWCGGIGVGGGGALPEISKIKVEHGPMAPVDGAVFSLAEKILECEVQKNSFVSVGIPRIAYQLAGQMGWRQMIRKNGGKVRDLGKRWK